MATILYIGTSGSNDPTRATLPFLSATGAIEAGHQPQIALVGEATYLMKSSVADTIQGVATPGLKDLLAKVIENGVQIHV
jgi:predicted peroxiredoxin